MRFSLPSLTEDPLPLQYGADPGAEVAGWDLQLAFPDLSTGGTGMKASNVIASATPEAMATARSLEAR